MLRQEAIEYFIPGLRRWLARIFSASVSVKSPGRSLLIVAIFAAAAWAPTPPLVIIGLDKPLTFLSHNQPVRIRCRARQTLMGPYFAVTAAPIAHR